MDRLFFLEAKWERHSIACSNTVKIRGLDAAKIEITNDEQIWGYF